MDITRAIHYAILDKLVKDTDLIELLGNDNIRVDIGARSDEYPYIVFNVDFSVGTDTPLVGTGRMEMHLWDENPLTTRVNEIRGEIVKLLDCSEIILNGGEAKGVRIFWDNSLKVPDSVEHIQHIVLLFSVKLIRSIDLNY
jgi:hypothetical protein